MWMQQGALITTTTTNGIIKLMNSSPNLRNFRRYAQQQQEQQHRQQYYQRRHHQHQVKVTQSINNSTSNSNDDDDGTATMLVDNLLHYTHSIMEKNPQRHHAVAFSGGVDSSLVLALLKKATGSSDVDAVVQPVLGISPAVSSEQIDLARRVSSSLDIPLTEVRTTEGFDDVYIANAGEACYACKTHLYTSLQLVLDHAASQQKNNNNSGALYNGTNADDVRDPTRLGLIAAANFQVLSPLEYTSKDNVRKAAKHLGLPNWNYAASPCLRSRLALGVEATQHHLQMIEHAERIVKETLLSMSSTEQQQQCNTLRFNETTNMRVRLLSKQRARIEIDPQFIQIAQTLLPTKWITPFQKLGFSNVDVKLFKSGSVAGGTKQQKNKSTTELSSTTTTTQSSLSSSLAA